MTTKTETQDQAAEDAQTPSVEERFCALAVFLAESLIPAGEEADITANAWVNDNTLNIVVNAPSSLRGRLIGRSGHMARSLRSLMELANIETPHRLSLDFAD